MTLRLILETIWDCGYYAGINQTKECKELNVNNMIQAFLSHIEKESPKERKLIDNFDPYNVVDAINGAYNSALQDYKGVIKKAVEG